MERKSHCRIELESVDYHMCHYYYVNRKCTLKLEMEKRAFVAYGIVEMRKWQKQIEIIDRSGLAAMPLSFLRSRYLNISQAYLVIIPIPIFLLRNIFRFQYFSIFHTPIDQQNFCTGAIIFFSRLLCFHFSTGRIWNYPFLSLANTKHTHTDAFCLCVSLSLSRSLLLSPQPNRFSFSLCLPGQVADVAHSTVGGSIWCACKCFSHHVCSIPIFVLAACCCRCRCCRGRTSATTAATFLYNFIFIIFYRIFNLHTKHILGIVETKTISINYIY